jgi:membrane-associated phospholipid phosphatase
MSRSKQQQHRPFFIKQNINKLALLAGILVLLFPQGAFAQAPSPYPDYAYKPNKAYWKSYWTVTKKIPTGPARWKTAEWIAFSGIVAGGVVVYIYDDEIRQWIQRNPTHTKENLSKYVFEPWGSGFYPAFLLGGFYIYGLAAKSHKARQVALGGAQAFVMTAITTQIIKHLTHRHRPNQDEPPNPRLWEGPFTGWEYDAWPSGHTSTAFALATLISSVYRDKIWVSILSYTLATGTAWSRIYDNKHWPSDVLFGAALGFAIGKTVYHVMQGKSNLSLGVSDTGGIALVYRLK